jgi:hypothetical protein
MPESGGQAPRADRGITLHDGRGFGYDERGPSEGQPLLHVHRGAAVACVGARYAMFYDGPFRNG